MHFKNQFIDTDETSLCWIDKYRRSKRYLIKTDIHSKNVIIFLNYFWCRWWCQCILPTTVSYTHTHTLNPHTNKYNVLWCAMMRSILFIWSLSIRHSFQFLNIQYHIDIPIRIPSFYFSWINFDFIWNVKLPYCIF